MLLSLALLAEYFETFSPDASIFSASYWVFWDFFSRLFCLILFWDASVEFHSETLLSWRCFYPNFMEMFLSWRRFYLNFMETLLSWRCFYLNFMETLLSRKCFYPNGDVFVSRMLLSEFHGDTFVSKMLLSEWRHFCLGDASIWISWRHFCLEDASIQMETFLSQRCFHLIVKRHAPLWLQLHIPNDFRILHSRLFIFFSFLLFLEHFSMPFPSKTPNPSHFLSCLDTWVLEVKQRSGRGLVSQYMSAFLWTGGCSNSLSERTSQSYSGLRSIFHIGHETVR